MAGNKRSKNKNEERVASDPLFLNACLHSFRRSAFTERLYQPRKSESGAYQQRRGLSEGREVSGSIVGVSQCVTDRRQLSRRPLGVGARLRRSVACSGDGR